MKNIFKGVSIALFIIGFLMGAMYLGLSWYYVEEFSYNTWINGVYCTGKSVAEVNRELRQNIHYENLTVWDINGQRHEIAADDISYSVDFTAGLEAYKNQQNPYRWIDNMFWGNGEKQLPPVIAYDEAALTNEITTLPFMRTAAARTVGEVAIRKLSSGYALVNQRENVLNQELARVVIQGAIERMEAQADLAQAGCYYDLPLDDKMKKTLELWTKVQNFQDCQISYQIGGETILIDAAVVSEWIGLTEAGEFDLDEQGNLTVDEEKVKQFVAELAAKYDTVGMTREFKATRGDTVTLSKGTYGRKLDQEAETAYLIEALGSQRREVHRPQYLQEAFAEGADDLGDTYIEIDMSNQMMYYYLAGKCVISTPVVTGNTALRRGTPEGVNFVYAKQRDRILRGEDYASPVDYWIPVIGAVGIHDASWRRNYGGEIYKTNGSHGCINTPFEAVEQLYEMVEIGTPCVMFY